MSEKILSHVYEKIISIKAFIAGMLALYIAMRLGLENPAWSMSTVYIITLPYAGQSFAKGFARIIGTIISACVGLFIIVTFIDAPVLMMSGIALWLSLCVYLYIQVKHPFGYAFRLAGYALLSCYMAHLDNPQLVFSSGLSRIEEISLGVICYTLIDALFFPRRSDTIYIDSLKKWLHDVSVWSSELLSTPPVQHSKTRKSLIAQLGRIDNLRQQVIYDSPRLSNKASALLEIQCQFQNYFSIMVAIEDRLVHLSLNKPDVLSKFRDAMKETNEAITFMDSGISLPGLNKLLSRLQHVVIQTNDSLLSDDMNIQHLALDKVLSILLEKNKECHGLLTRIEKLPAHMHKNVQTKEMKMARYSDPVLGLVAALVPGLSFLILSVFVHYTAWPMGYAAVQMAAIICAVASNSDNPLIGTKKFFLYYAVYSLPIAIVYQYIIFPCIHDFPSLVLSLAPVFLWGGYQQAKGNGGIMILMIGCVSFLAFNNESLLSFVDLLNKAVAMQIGLAVPLLLTGLLRKLDSHWIGARLRNAMDKELNEAALGAPITRTEYESKFQDMMHGLLTRTPENKMSDVVNGASASLRIGIALLQLHMSQSHLLPHSRKLLASARHNIAHYFSSQTQQTDLNFNLLRENLESIKKQLLHSAYDTDTDTIRYLISIINSLELHRTFFIRNPMPV